MLQVVHLLSGAYCGWSSSVHGPGTLFDNLLLFTTVENPFCYFRITRSGLNGARLCVYRLLSFPWIQTVFFEQWLMSNLEFWRSIGHS